MGHHNHGLVPTTAEGFYDFPDATAVVRIQPMQRFVKNQQFGIFHKGTRQQGKALLAAGQLQERLVLQMRHTENIHPPLAYSHLAGMRTFVQTDAVVQSGSYDFDGRQVSQIGTVHLRTDVTYMLLDFPNALSRTSLTAEQTDVAGIRLRIVESVAF